MACRSVYLFTAGAYCLSELKLEYESHLVNLHAGENATEWYQAIHPDGVVPALVDDGRLVVESVDIIDYLACKQNSRRLMPDEPGLKEDMYALMKRADQAQKDLKLLTFEFLFKAAPASSDEIATAFQSKHKNQWLKAFHRDFRAGFERCRIEESATTTDIDFKFLEQSLSDGRQFLAGDTFSLADIAWISNFHRFDLIGWPFERYPNLQGWFKRVSARLSYKTALENWEPRNLLDTVMPRLAERRAAGDGVETYLKDQHPH